MLRCEALGPQLRAEGWCIQAQLILDLAGLKRPAAAKSTGPQRHLTFLDLALAAPHILDDILDDHRTWRGLRHTCRHFKHAVDARMYHHILIKGMSGTDGHVVTVARPRGWSLPGFPPRRYAQRRLVWTRLLPTRLRRLSQAVPLWAQPLTHTHVVDLDLGPFSHTLVQGLQPYLRPNTLRIRVPSAHGRSVRERQVPPSSSPAACPIGGARRVVLFPTPPGGWGYDRPTRVDVLSAGGGSLEKLVVNVLVTFDGGCAFPPFEPFDPAIGEVVIIFTLFESDADKYSRPCMFDQWSPFFKMLAQTPDDPFRPVTLVDLPDLDFSLFRIWREEPNSLPPSPSELFCDILRSRGAQCTYVTPNFFGLSLFRFLRREDYARSVGAKVFDLETRWSE